MAASKTAAGAAPKATPTITTDEQILATRYKQGGRSVFATVVSPLQLINMVAQPDPDVPNPGNRAITVSHARDFANYYINHDNWVIPGIILRAPSIFKYDQEAGILSYPKRSAGRLQILDGQHRVLGFHMAANMINVRLDEAVEQRGKALKIENGDKNAPLVVEAERRLAEARALEDRFDSEGISIDIQVTDDNTASRQMFFDIADNQLGISSSVKVRFDTRKAINRALPMVLDHPLLKNRVDLEKDRIPYVSEYLMTARHVADIIRALELGINGRMGKLMEASMNENDAARHANTYLDDAIEAFPQLEAIRDGKLSPNRLRETSMLGSPALLRILGAVYRELTDLGGVRHWGREQVVEFFKTIEPHLYDGAHRNSIWYRIETKNKNGGTQKAFTEGAYAPNGRRQDLEAVTNALIEWAILGKKGAPWLWAKPAAAPEPEKTEDELVLEAQKEADPELEKLLADQLAFNEKTKAKNAKK